MKKAVWVFRIFSYLLLIAAIALTIGCVVALLLGMKLYCVQTGSMYPKYPVGTLIVVSPTEPESIQTGDVITFVISSNTVVTHRVVEVDKDRRSFVTKGDNNNVADTEPVRYENLLGKVELGVPYIGLPVLLARTHFGMIMIGVIIVVMIVGRILVVWIRKEDDEVSENPES